MRVVVALVAVCLTNVASALRADRFDDYTLMGFYAPASAGAFQDAFDCLDDGRVIFIAANDVFIESSPGSRTFKALGPLTGQGAPVSYPAFIRVTPDGSLFAVGNNFDAVGIFRLRDLRGVWYRVDHFDADWLDNRHLVIRAGEVVTLLDTKSSPEKPVNPILIDNCPVSAGITFDVDDNLYTGNGFGNGEPSDTGWIMYFPAKRWRGVLRGDPVIDFEEEGVLVVDLLSATALGFDAEGHLHVGGGDFDTGDLDYAGLVNAGAIADAIAGRGPADPEDPDEVRKLDPDSNTPDNWYDVTISAVKRELLIRDGSTSTVYVHGLPGGVKCDNVRKLKAKCRAGSHIRIRVRLRDGRNDGDTMYVAADDIPFLETVKGKKLISRSGGWDAGEHSVSLVDPSECLSPVIVDCK